MSDVEFDDMSIDGADTSATILCQHKGLYRHNHVDAIYVFAMADEFHMWHFLISNGLDQYGFCIVYLYDTRAHLGHSDSDCWAVRVYNHLDRSVGGCFITKRSSVV